jgi:hypothetical protein
VPDVERQIAPATACRDAGEGPYLAASTRRWLANGGFQGHQFFQGGPLRRKKRHRRLDLLDEQTKREPNPVAARTHVRIIEVLTSADVVGELES